jgi:hypothetical protein
MGLDLSDSTVSGPHERMPALDDHPTSHNKTITDFSTGFILRRHHGNTEYKRGG